MRYGLDPNGSLTQWVGAEVPYTIESLALAVIYAAAFQISVNFVIEILTSASSSGSSLFGLLNEIQLVIVLSLLFTYMPDKIYNYLKSMKAGLFNADFLPIGESNKVSNFKKMFDFSQAQTYLKLFGLTSESVFINILNLTVIVEIIAWFHVFLIALFAIF